MIFKMLLLAAVLWAAPAVAQTYPPQVSAIDPASKIDVANASAADAKRADLIQKIYGAGALNAPNPAAYYSTFNPAGSSWAAVPNIAAIEEWRVTTSRGFLSRLYRFKPAVYRNPSSGKGAMIVSAGHGHIGTYPPYQPSIAYLVASGYEIWTVDMPLSGLNPGPVVVNDPTLGMVQIRTHDDMQVLKTPSFNPLRVFLEPVTAIVDDLTSRGVTNIAAMGLSGGGWTVALYSALDTRILAAYSVAGSMPIYTRSWSPPHNALGDWEQREIPALGTDYLTLYVLAAQGRRFVAIHNVNDDCCFGGWVAAHYTSAVNAAVASVGGSYGVQFDSTATTHTISPWAHNWIWADLALRF